MGEVEEQQLVDELRALGRAAGAPDVDPHRMAVAVTRGLPRPRRRWSRRRTAVVVVTALLALVATGPVRAAVADWLAFVGVRVEEGDPGGDAAPPPQVPAATEVDEAAARVSFPVLVPAALDDPAGVQVSPDGRMVSMTWRVGGAVLRLDQFDGSLDLTMAKVSPQPRFVRVGAVDALWFEEPHEVVVLDRDGTRRTETARLAGQTLIWPRGDTTLRLEGELGLDDAVAIAASMRPVP